MQRLSDMAVDPFLTVLIIILLWISNLIGRHAANGHNTTGLLFLFVVVVGMAVLVGSPSVVNPLVDKLESRYSSTPACSGDYTPLVVLGGGVDSRIASVAQLHLMKQATFARVNEARLMIAEQVGLDYPVILAGGGSQTMSEADVMAQFLLLSGTPPTRLVRESSSVNTAANAHQVARIFAENQWVKKIRLLTSALHMYRAAGVFRKLGFDVCPISVDRQALQDVPWYAVLPQTSVLLKSDKLWHELAGILYYRMRRFI